MADVAAALSPDHGSSSWLIVSDLPGRLRIRQSALIDSVALRRHCLSVLGSCHWLLGVRLNSLAGSLCITYPSERREEVSVLLARALRLSPLEQSLAAAAEPGQAYRALKRTLVHGAACLSLLALESVVAIPAAVMGGATALLLWPLLREVVPQLRRRQLTMDGLELSFSGLMVQQGLAAEALVDLALGDGVRAVQRTVDSDDLRLDRDHLLDRLGRTAELEAVSPDGSSRTLLLLDGDVGTTIRLRQQQHCFLTARLISGELVIMRRMVDGDWRPQRLSGGDAVEPGALIISGNATAVIEHSIATDPAYSLLREHHARPAPTEAADERWIADCKRLMPPVLLGLGGVLLSLGANEQALAALQFNPINDWERHRLAARITAIADLRLHSLTIRHPQAIETLGTIDHLLIDRSSLDRLGGLRVHERIATGSQRPSGFLLQLLAGVQSWFRSRGGALIWSRQLEQEVQPLALRTITVNDLRDGWLIEAEDGRRWTLRQVTPVDPDIQPSADLSLEIWENGSLLGQLELERETPHHWLETSTLLRDLGITLHLITAEPVEQLDAFAEGLGVSREHRHGSCSASDRLALVERLQQQGKTVGYQGYVLNDLPALAQADVSISRDVDDDDHGLAGICFLSLTTESQWLPRLIRISRDLSRARQQNLGLLAASQLASSLAIAAGLIAPLQMVLLTNLPLVLVELNHLQAQNRTLVPR